MSDSSFLVSFLWAQKDQPIWKENSSVTCLLFHSLFSCLDRKAWGHQCLNLGLKPASLLWAGRWRHSRSMQESLTLNSQIFSAEVKDFMAISAREWGVHLNLNFSDDLRVHSSPKLYPFVFIHLILSCFSCWPRKPFPISILIFRDIIIHQPKFFDI